MKKKFISVLSVILFLTFSVSVNAAPASPDIQTYTEDLGNGLYGVTTLEIESGNARTTKTATKTYVMKNSAGETVASYQLKAAFLYPAGNTAKCTYVTHSTSISDNNWSFSDAASMGSANKATGKFTANLVVLGIRVQTISRVLTLTCDKNGNIS